jgi:HK97 family phage major capsid protein
MNTELKFLFEQRADKIEEMKKMVNAAKLEKRAMSEAELASFDEIKKTVRNMDETIKAEESARMEELEVVDEKTAEKPTANEEERAFTEYIRSAVSGKLELRANMTLGDNGAVIPTTIAQKIIEYVRTICPIYEKADIYNVAGNLVIPSYPVNTAVDITCAYATEFTDLASTAGAFASVNMAGYLAGALTKISKSLINRADIDIVGFVVRKMGDAIAYFLENEFLNGTGTDACQGILTGATNVATTAAVGIIRADDLIDLQESIIDQYQSGAVWIMSRKTRAAIRKFKDANEHYLLNQDLTAKWGYTLLGKPVYTSDNMPDIAQDANAVIYGDLTGLSVKYAKGMEIQVLNELYAAQHVVGVVGWIEVDSKVTNQQKLAILKIKKTS